MKTKVCTKCGRELPLEEFHKNADGKYDRMSWCKHCRLEYVASKIIGNRICEYCGKKYDYTSLSGNHYCSRICYYAAISLRKQKRLRKIPCKYCGNIFEITDSRLRKGEGVYCSRKCHAAGSKISDYTYNNPLVEGKRIKNKAGYILIRLGGPGWNYKAEHRLVMEKHLGRILLGIEQVHHRNGIKTIIELKILNYLTHKLMVLNTISRENLIEIL